MLASLLTAVVLGTLIYMGYRFNMYLYSQGVVGVGSHQMQSVAMEQTPVQPVRDLIMEERDYGLRYARTGLLVISSIVVVLVAGLIIALFSML